MFDAYLFDLDGTLLDSEPWHKASEIEAFRSFGLELTESDLEPYVGTTLPAMLKGIGKSHGVHVTPDEFRVVGQPILSRYILDELAAFEDALSVLSALSGARKAIVTSSMRWYVDATSAKFPWMIDSFETLVCQADVTHGKPNPEPYALACSRLGVEPSRCLVIEDAHAGALAGLAAGCRVAKIGRDEGSRPTTGVHWHISNLNEILDLRA